MAMGHDRTSEESIFCWIDRVLQSGNVAEGFDQLADRFRRGKQYRELFDSRLIQKRFELALPLLSSPAIVDLPQELQRAYQNASVYASREVGELLLADGSIPQSWPYFRAIGDSAP